jgi:GNAT superfamily N-acetyltransferase
MNQTWDIAIRPATLDDVPELLRQRRSMYEAMGTRDEVALSAMIAASAEYLPKVMADGSFRGWLAEVDGRVVGGGGVIVTPWLAHPHDLACRHATVLNVYVDAEFRRRGIARKVMETILEWCRGEGLAAVFLHASDEGRRLYESMGFQVGNEMKLLLR